MMRVVTLSVVATMVLAGCTSIGEPDAYQPITRDISMWVQAMDWTLHPNVTAPVWAFCAAGSGVELVHGASCSVPGPTIRVAKGDTIRLTFQNTHSIPHTVHFHGWHPFSADMNGAHLIDGAMVVPPEGEAIMTWIAEPAGSFIYHCHFQTPTHMEMGMAGAFIVEDRGAAVPDKEFVAVLDEWSVRDPPDFHGNMPAYNYFTINGKSFPTTQPWIARQGETVRLHLVNAGFEFHAMHLHGYTPDAYEGVAGPRHAVPTDVREIAPGQTVVMDFEATREGVWLFHDHVVPRVTAASDGHGFGAYPRGMLTVFVVGQIYEAALAEIVPVLLAAAAQDTEANVHATSQITESQVANDTSMVNVRMKNFVFSPEEIRIPANTTVSWSNQDGTFHTVTENDGIFDSEAIQPGAAWSYTFTEPGTYSYYCKPHAYEQDGVWKGMVATVVVE